MKKGVSKFYTPESLKRLEEALMKKPMSAPEIMEFLGFDGKHSNSQIYNLLITLERSGLLLYEENYSKRNTVYGAISLKTLDEKEEERRKKLCLTM